MAGIMALAPGYRRSRPERGGRLHRGFVEGMVSLCRKQIKPQFRSRRDRLIVTPRHEAPGAAPMRGPNAKGKAGEAEFDIFNVYETAVFMTLECTQSLRHPPPLLYEAYRRNIASI
jgi:hypothetical protein